MRKIIFAFSFLVLLNSTLFGQSEITKDEYDFYSTFLDKKRVVKRETIIPEVLDSERLVYRPKAKKFLEKLPKDLIADFTEKNKYSSTIENKLPDFRFSDQSDPTWNKYNKEKNEIHFVYQAYQSVSRVGFSKNKKYALVSIAEWTEGLPMVVKVLFC